MFHVSRHSGIIEAHLHCFFTARPVCALRSRRTSCHRRKRAGADAADAIAVRGVSLSVEVREGAVEESQRSEGDDVGLRVLVGLRQAVVSTNDARTDGLDALAERAVAMARAAPEDRFAGLADAALLAHDFPALDLLDPDMPTVDVLEKRAREAEAAGMAVPA